MLLVASLPFVVVGGGLFLYRIWYDQKYYQDLEATFIGLALIIQSVHFLMGNSFFDVSGTLPVVWGVFCLLLGLLNLYTVYILYS